MNMLPVKRNELIKVDEVFSKLTDIQKTICRTSIKTPIKQLKHNDFVKSIKNDIGFIIRDVGIKTYDDYDVIRFVDILTKYYSKLSLDDVKLAFEFTLIGKLDTYLPKNSNGTPNKEHWGSFSVEYISKILNAYIKLQDATWIQYRALLPEVTITVTQEKKNEIHNNFLNVVIVGQFEKKKENIYHILFFPSPEYVIEILISCGLIKKKPKYKKKHIEEAHTLISRSKNNINEFLYSSIKESKGFKEHDYTIERAKDVCYIEEINKLFIDLISKNQNIKTLLNYGKPK